MTLATYDPEQVFRAIDDHLLVVLLLLAATMIATGVYLVSAFRTGARHRAYTVPLLAACVYAVHDASFVLHWDTWFGTYDHWWPRVWAVGLIGATVLELGFVHQVARYGHGDLLPMLGRRQFRLAVLGVLVAVSLFWVVFDDAFDDPLYLRTFAITAWMGSVFSNVLVCTRGSTRGQTRTMAVALIVVAAAFWILLAIIAPTFRDPAWLAFGAVSVVWGCFNVWLVGRLGPYDPDAPPARAPAGPAVASGSA